MNFDDIEYWTEMAKLKAILASFEMKAESVLLLLTGYNMMMILREGDFNFVEIIEVSFG